MVLIMFEPDGITFFLQFQVGEKLALMALYDLIQLCVGLLYFMIQVCYFLFNYLQVFFILIYSFSFVLFLVKKIDQVRQINLLRLGLLLQLIDHLQVLQVLSLGLLIRSRLQVHIIFQRTNLSHDPIHLVTMQILIMCRSLSKDALFLMCVHRSRSLMFFIETTHQFVIRCWLFQTETFYDVYVIKSIESTSMEEPQEIMEPLKFVWNVTPSTRLLQAKSSIHPAFHYTPLEAGHVDCLQYIPLTCSCEGAFNTFCPIDFAQKTIKCCLCGNIQSLPQNYAQHICPQKLPFELLPQNSTFQFKSHVNKNLIYRYSYIFTVDISIDEKQLSSIKEQLVRVVESLPSTMNVGLVTYAKNIGVYELGSKINTVYHINGLKQYNYLNIMDLIGITVKNDPHSQSSDIAKRFVVPLDSHRQSVIKRIKDIKIDRNIYINQRVHSTFGQALNISICIAEASTIASRIVFLVGNPCTLGSGTTISTDYKEQMRSPKELSEGQNIKYFVSAKQYYDSFIRRVLSKKIILDMFAFSLNEIGFTEMSDLFISSGGLVVMHEQFRERIFVESFHKIFPSVSNQNNEGKLLSMTEAQMMVFASPEVTINGALGQCYSLNKMKTFVSDKVMGKGKTHAWYLGGCDQHKTITIMYESKEAEAKEQFFYIQMKIIYKNQQGESITRVTTVKKEWSNQNTRIAENFDEEAGIVYLARQCVQKMLYEEQKNVRHWLDQSLVKWALNYASFIKNDQTSFSLPATMKRLPQLVFHLRRSHFVNRFGISLDESFYKGLAMNREMIVNCLAMIQPALLMYTLENPQPVPVPLDQEEMKDDVILLLDSYFVVIEWHGETIHSWYENKYHEQAEYQHIGELFNSPKLDIDYVMATRFPVPNFYQVHPSHSKERYLKSRVNPKKNSAQENENMITDDSDLKGFTQYLIRVVVKQT